MSARFGVDQGLGAEARGRSAPEATEASSAGIERLLVDTTDRLQGVYRKQVHRDPWPVFDAFDVDAYPFALRRAAAVQWAGRARAEHGSVHQFSAIAHALTEARAPLDLLGSLARLITDEVRHAELCAKMAVACDPDGPSREPRIFACPLPRAPWPAAPRAAADPEPVLAWAARAIAVACCIGETLSRPMLDAIAVVSTDPVAEACARQILRDEHLHAAFGWDAMAVLMPRLSPASAESVYAVVSRALAGYEASTCCGIPVQDVAGSEIEIERGTGPNLGTLTDLQYAMIFYATLESEVLPGFERLGIDGARAWAERGA